MHGVVRLPNSNSYVVESYSDQEPPKLRSLSRNCQYYAGPAFYNSPPASALPFPKKFWKDNATVPSKKHLDDVEVCDEPYFRITNEKFLECLEGAREDIECSVRKARAKINSLKLLVKQTVPLEERVSNSQKYRGSDTCHAQTERLLAQHRIYFQSSSIYASLLKKYWPEHFEKYATSEEACDLTMPNCGWDASHIGCSETRLKSPIPLPINNARSNL